MGGTEGLWRDDLIKLSVRRSDATVNIRMDCLHPETVKKYFELLKDVLIEN